MDKCCQQKLYVDGFKERKGKLRFDDKGCIFKVNTESPTKLHKLHSDLPFSPECMKTGKWKQVMRNQFATRSLAEGIHWTDTELKTVAKNNLEKNL